MLHQFQALRQAIKQAEELGRCRLHTKPLHNIGEVSITGEKPRKVTIMQRVFVLSKTKKPLMPCHSARARKLLKMGKAAIFRFHPFTIVLREREEGETQRMQLKFNPGSKVTGIALVLFGKKKKQLAWAVNLEHRGAIIKKKLLSRRAVRRARRFRNTRYRKPRFLNRTRKKGWLAPSLQSRVDNITSWTSRTKEFVPVSDIAVETVKFDIQKLQNPEISGVDFNNIRWIDAACVGKEGEDVSISPHLRPIHIKAVGRGSRQMCHVNKYGFPRSKAKSQKIVRGFKTGDFVKAIVPKGKNKGTHFGTVAVRLTGIFCLNTPNRKVDVNAKHCVLVQKATGYSFSLGKALGAI